MAEEPAKLSKRSALGRRDEVIVPHDSAHHSEYLCIYAIIFGQFNYIFYISTVYLILFAYLYCSPSYRNETSCLSYDT